MKKMKFYSINFNSQTSKIEAEVENINVNDTDIYEQICKILNCKSLEFIDYNYEIVMIVDEYGKYKKKNPVFNVNTEDGSAIELAGKILFARNIYNEFSTDIGSITYEDIFSLRIKLGIHLLGVVKGI